MKPPLPTPLEAKSLTGPKRIAMFSLHSDPLVCLGSQQAGGQNLYVRSLAEELNRLGWEIDIFTRWDNRNKKQLAYLTKKTRVIRLKGGRVGYMTKKELLEVLPEIYNNFLLFIDSKNPYCLFHGHYWDGGWMALKAHLQFKKPLVTNFHSLGMIRMETKKRYLKDQNEYNYFTERLNIENEIIKGSSVIISLAESEKKELNRLYGCSLEKCAVIPGGVALKRWEPIEKIKARETAGLEKEDFVLVYVGRLEWRKGIGTLISAGNLLRKEIPELKILIVGGQIFGSQKDPEDFKEYNRLQKKAQEQEVVDIVRFVGRVANRRLTVFYSSADVLVIPSYYEPFGLVTLEGMASKLPIVASGTGGLANIIKDGENGLLFTPHNPMELKEKILMLYRSQDLKEKICRNAYEEAKKYSWEGIANKINEIYKSLISESYENCSNCPI